LKLETEDPSSPTSPRGSDPLIIGIAFFSFVVLGMPGAMLNVAWHPAIRSAFGLSLDAVGVLYLASTLGYSVGGSFSGRLMTRLGAGRMLILSAIVSAGGLLGYALAPAWAALVLCGLVLGLGSGILDGGMNIHFAANFGPRQMNWLHACFGIGATLAPLAMTAILRAGSSWRWGYGLAMLFYALLAVLFALTRTRWHLPLASGSVEGGAHAAVGQTLKLPLVWLGIGLFLILTGLEVCAGQWAAPLFTEARGVRQEIAGLWVGVYWGSFTVGRILFGTLVAWVRPAVMIRFGLAGMAAGAVLLGSKSQGSIAFLGLALIGFALSPIFALMISSTQERLGPVHAPNAIGLQVAAAGLGVGILPGVMGVLAKRHGLEVVPWLLLGLTGVMAVLYEAIRSQRLGAPSPAVTPAD
jgi:fucose permease